MIFAWRHLSSAALSHDNPYHKRHKILSLCSTRARSVVSLLIALLIALASQSSSLIIFCSARLFGLSNRISMDPSSFCSDFTFDELGSVSVSESDQSDSFFVFGFFVADFFALDLAAFFDDFFSGLTSTKSSSESTCCFGSFFGSFSGVSVLSK